MEHAPEENLTTRDLVYGSTLNNAFNLLAVYVAMTQEHVHAVAYKSIEVQLQIDCIAEVC